MKKYKNLILILLFALFISCNVVNAQKEETCHVNFNASKINNQTKSFNAMIGYCPAGTFRPTATSGGTWIVNKSDSPRIKVNATMQTFKFSNLGNLTENKVGDFITMTYTTPKDIYVYHFIFTFLTDKSTGTGKCCRSIDGNQTKYTWDITNNSCNVVSDITNEDACSAKNGNASTTIEDKEVCILTGKHYSWGKRSSIQAGSKETSYSKEECNTKMSEQSAKDAEEGNARIEESMSTIEEETEDSGYTSTGQSACKNYQIVRVRIYNPKSSDPEDKYTHAKFANARSEYFKSPVTASNSSVNYYNIYKATCTDTGESVSSFCIDPGLTGPLSTSINYKPGDTIDPNTQFGRGLYRLYSYWYVDGEGRNKIIAQNPTLTSGSFDAATVQSDYVDYVVNNVTRLLVYNYGSTGTPTISFQCDSGKGSGRCTDNGWAGKEIKYYEKSDFPANSSAAEASRKLLQEVWEDVKKYINESNVSSTDKTIPTAEGDWIIPVGSYVKLVGDFRTNAKTGYYCNSQKGVAVYNETEFSKNESGNKHKHNGVDFTIDKSDIGKIPVYAAQTGIITAAGKISNDGSMGNAIVIIVKLADGTELKTRYLHLASIESSVYTRAKATNYNQKVVKKGELIGYVGNTGKSSGPHLHFDISSNDGANKQNIGTKIYSPRNYLPMNNTVICSQTSWKQENPNVTTETSIVNSQAYKSVEVEKSDVNTSITADGRGFEASFKITLSSNLDIEALNNITKCDSAGNCNWSITATTDTGDDIPVDKSQVTLENNAFTEVDSTTRTGKFKVSVPDGLVNISSEATKVKIKFNFSYTSPYSIDNILLLTTSEYSKEDGKYQRFITFLNGTISRYEAISIDIPDAEKDKCNPMFSMMCTPINTVSYLIEGTQSPEIFNKIMSGINTVGDLVNVINKSTQILDRLKNNNLTSNDVLYIGSLAYNIAGDLLNFTTIQKQLESFLDLPELKDNKTAQRLKQAIVKDTIAKKYLQSEKVDKGLWCTIKGWFGADGKCYKDVEHTQYVEEIPDYSKDEPRAFIDFANMLVKVIKGDDDNYQSIKNDWKQILEVSKTYSKDYSKISSFVSTISNFVNGMKSKENLNRVLDGLNSFGSSLLDGTIFDKTPTLNDIKNTAQNISTAIQGTLQMATTGITDIINQLKSLVTNLDPKNMDLSDVSDVLNLFTKATTTDWENCIIGKEDPNGNSYEVQNQNLYCSISCKEDYAFKMPGNLGTVSPGQNLTTTIDNVYQATVGVAGQRTCVTTSIDNNAYQADAFDKKQEILEKYNALMKAYSQQSKVLNSDTGTTTPATWNTLTTITQNELDKLIDKVKDNLQKVFNDTMEEFAYQLLGADSSSQAINNLKSRLISKGETIIANLGSKIVSNLLSGKTDIGDIISMDDIKNEFTKTFEDEVKNFTNNFKNALNSSINYFTNHLGDIVTEATKTLAGDALKMGGTALLAAACHSTKALAGIPFVGPFLAAAGEAICETYAAVSTTIAPIVQSVSQATGGLILGYYTPAKSTYDYRYDLFSYGELPVTGLNTCSQDYAYKSDDNEYYTKVLKGDIVCVGTNMDRGELHGNEIFIPVLEPGTYKPSTLSLGFTLNINHLRKGVEGIKSLGQKIPDLLTDISGFADPDNSSFINALNALGNPTISNLKAIFDYVKNGGFKKDADGLNNTFPTIFNHIASNSSTASAALTDLIDTSLNAVYNLLGGFSPYYAEIANINNQLLSSKKEYNTARDELAVLARNMHDCTVWTNEFTFNPKITFNYGYRYFGAVKDATTDSIDLEMINKNESADEIFYYCDNDVNINDVQSINTILSGKCTTSDGIIGGILSAFLGDNETFKGISKFISDNSSIIRNFMSDDAIKQYLGDDFYNKLCVIAGEDLCVSSKDDALTTGIPGEVIYLMRSDASLKSTLDSLKFSFNLDSVKDGTIFAKFVNAIMGNFSYGPATKDDVTYRNVGRVVRVSRYGNPGLSISGLSMTRFLENMVTYVANYLHVGRDSIATKLYDALLSVTGEGAQKFVYFRSSKPYFTYSNKGIYTNDANESSDTIAIDYGDENLYNDSITSGTSDDKKATGKSYPIALTTEPGTYFYNITFNNIGQYYNNNFSLGRIVDDDGYINGTMANQYACYYQVEEKPNNDSLEDCEALIENAAAECKTEDGKQFYKDLYKSNYTDIRGTDYKAKWGSCINKLLAGNNTACCDYIKDAVPDTSEEEFKRVCNSDGDSKCRGVSLFACINSDNATCDSISAISNRYDRTDTSTPGNQTAIINGNGSLQFYTKIVSNYDLFPNGNASKGKNWVGSTSGNENRDETGKPVKEKINDIISEIERKGDEIYDETPEYYIELSGACMSKIKEYNRQQEMYDLGFGDYTSSSKNRETREFESSFLKDLENDSEYSDCAKYIENNLH